MADLDTISSLISSDAEIASHVRARVIGMIDLVLDQVVEDLEHGDAAARTAAYRQFLPLLIKVAQQTESDDDQLAKALAEGQRVLAELQAALPVYDAFEGDDGV